MGSLRRTVGLWMLILGDVSLITLLAICQQWFWVFTFVNITLTILTVEGLAKLLVGKTISQLYYKFRQDKPVMSLLALISFALAMAGLFIHLL